MKLASSLIQFELPHHLACPEPTERRNMERDEIRLLVTKKQGQTEHTIFKDLPRFLNTGDVLVVNTSATIPAALPVSLPGGAGGRLHISTRLNNRNWLIEIREISGNRTVRWKGGEEGMAFQLRSGAVVTLEQRFYDAGELLHLWMAHFTINQPMQTYLSANALPVQYDNLSQQYPLSYYQTFFSFHPGSAEMPSAGRGFTTGLTDRLLKKGIVLAPIVLHTGVSSLEEKEMPYPEHMEIDPVTASIINSAKSNGKRIIAVGTTAIRAIETAVNEQEKVVPYRGQTKLFIDKDHTLKVANGLLTGFHEPHASHLNILQAVAGFEHINSAYKAALKAGYYWHQFGDLHLILP